MEYFILKDKFSKSDEDENTYSENNLPLLIKERGIIKIEFMRLPLHFVPRNDISKLLLP